MSYPTDADAPPVDGTVGMVSVGDWSPPVSRGMENAVLVLAREIANLADAMNHLAVASQAVRTPPGASKPPAAPDAAPPGVPGPPSPPGGATKTTEEKMAGKIYAICKSNNWDQASVCGEIVGFPVPDTRRLTKPQLAQILDQFAAWGYK